MKFRKTILKGLWVVESEVFQDYRGSFLKTFSKCDFELNGLSLNTANCYLTHNPVCGTLRGMHYQAEPYAEDKLVRCVSGRIFDVAVDLREKSETRYQWFGLELSGENHQALYIPKGFAHGFVSLTDNAMVQYQISNDYEPKAERGVSWDDPKIGIKWPIEPKIISEKDKSHPLL